MESASHFLVTASPSPSPSPAGAPVRHQLHAAASHAGRGTGSLSMRQNSNKSSISFSSHISHSNALSPSPSPSPSLSLRRTSPGLAPGQQSHGFTAGALSVQASASGPGAGEVVSVVGGTGFIGRALVARLLKDGSTVRVLTRSSSRAKPIFQGKPGADRLSCVDPGQWASAVEGATAVVNLAGTPISTRWSPSVKEDIVRSRVDTTNKISDAILAAPEGKRPSVFVSSSAVGYYGISETGTYDETCGAGNDFLAKVCVEWEAAAKRAEAGGVRLVIIRNGIVLEKDGGALGKMIPIFQVFAGGPLGSGTQWMSWIDMEDIVSLFVEAIRNPKYKGVINGSAPNPVRVSELCDQLGRVLGRPSWLPVPDFALKALLGEGASVVLDGQRVLPKKAEELGFQFKYRYLRDALAGIFS